MKRRFSILIVISVVTGYCLSILPFKQAAAQDDRRGMRVQQATPTERRVALVIGNSEYKDSPLSNPVNDARDMAAALREFSFDVVFGENLSLEQMERNIQAFGEKIRNGGVGLFYYAGHGMQVNGDNYLIPVDANITVEGQVKYRSVNVGLVLAQMEAARNRLNIVIFDACRNNPFARSFRSTQKGLASIDAPSGTLIAYATAPGSVASDGTGRNGLYTQELLKYMKQPDLSIEQLFKQVRASVRRRTEGKQTPWESSSLEGDFYFTSTASATNAAKNNPSVKPSSSTGAVPLPLRGFEFDTVTVSSSGSVTNCRKGQAQYFVEDINGVGLEMVEIPGGTFLMGSPDGEADRKADEEPQHQVSIPTFYMGKYEVTQAQWRAVASLPKIKRDLKPDTSYFKGDGRPVEQVAWEDAVEFCERLSRATGRQYRLPSEAEWEYACRARTTTPFAFGGTITPELVNYDGSHPYAQASEGIYRGITTVVGDMGVANAFGLFDMHGNVLEWCLDTWHEKYNGAPIDGGVWEGGDTRFRVARGGSWLGSGNFSRAAYRAYLPLDFRLFLIGFRVVAVVRTR